MTKQIWRWGLFFLILASVPALACNLFARDEGPPAPARDEQVVPSPDESLAIEATSTGPASQQPGLAGPAFSGVVAAANVLEQFGFYRIRTDIVFEHPSDPSESGAMSVRTSRIADPAATMTEVEVTGAFMDDAQLADALSSTFVEVEGTNYTILPGIGCIAGIDQNDMSDELGDWLELEELADGIADPQYVGEETINGIVTYHYRFDQTHLIEQHGNLEDVQGDIYVSQEHGYVVWMVMEGIDAVPDDDTQQQIVRVEMIVEEVGQPFTIEVPESCSATAADYPIMEGARDLGSFAGFTTYTVDGALDDAIAFYEQEMALLGYSAEASPINTDNFAMFTFRAEGQSTIIVNLTADDGVVNVVIMSEGDS